MEEKKQTETKLSALAKIHVLAGNAVSVLRRMPAITPEDISTKNRLLSIIGEINTTAVSYSFIYQTDKGEA